MKTCKCVSTWCLTLTCSATLWSTTISDAAPSTPAQKTVKPPAPAASTEIPRSVFVSPRGPQDGRDPFFPDSNRPYGASSVPIPTKSPSDSVVFKLNGRSGTKENPLAIINGYTMTSGEERDIPTPTGRVRVRCVEITDDVVIIEVGGERRELRLPPGN